jgi:hypothetical protein
MSLFTKIGMSAQHGVLATSAPDRHRDRAISDLPALPEISPPSGYPPAKPL